MDSKEILKNSGQKTRDYRYDNIRILLMFLVIMGHGMESFLDGYVRTIYLIIYSFHMPAFLYITGKFARFDRKKMIKHLIVPYFVFQTLGCFFDAFMEGTSVSIQYTTPTLAFWYLLAMIVYYLLLQILPEKGTRNSLLVIVGSVIISLLVGYETTICKYMSLSRIIVFAPFFLAGYYGDALRERYSHILSRKSIKTVGAVLCGIIICIGSAFVQLSFIKLRMLYGTHPYVATGQTILCRGFLLLVAAAWIVLLTHIIPNKKIPFITVAGQNTMPVFLIHNVFTCLIAKYEIMHYSQGVNLVLMCAISIAVIVAFGNKYVGKWFSKVF